MKKPVDFSNAWLKRALTEGLVDMGQISHEDRLLLNRCVRHGYLSKGKGGPYPILKTVYARPGFDFAQDREDGVAVLLRAHMLDRARGVACFFPMVRFQEIA